LPASGQPNGPTLCPSLGPAVRAADAGAGGAIDRARWVSKYRAAAGQVSALSTSDNWSNAYRLSSSVFGAGTTG
jgi:hypothetical protein